MAELKCTFASLPKTVRGQSIVLGGDPKGENFLYCNGNNVYIRDINDASKCDVYSEHSAQTTVAKYSPTRFYICSGDTSGKIRVWDTVNVEHILKNEFPVLGGAVKDIAWDGESKRIAVVGEGRESFAKCITADSGNTVGDLSGHNKSVNSVAIKANRPFRIATASEDQRVQFYEGPPFKFKAQHTDHTNFVNCVRYSPTGDVFVTAGADGKAFVHDGKTSEKIGELIDANVQDKGVKGLRAGGAEQAHGGGIFAMDFSPDGKELVTVSSDKTAKIWNIETRQPVEKIVMGTELEDQQLGCLWQGDKILTVSLSGQINYLDRNNPSAPVKFLKGHNKAIMAMAVTPDKSTIYSGASDGQILYWNASTGMCEHIAGVGHKSQVQDMTVAGDWLISISIDDTVRFTSITSNKYGSESCKLPSQPVAVAALPSGVAVIACIEHIVVVDKGNEMFSKAVQFGPSSVDIHPGGTIVAIGAANSKDVHIFNLDGTVLNGVRKIDINDDVTGVKYSPDGAYLAVITGSKRYTSLFRIEGNEYTEVYSKSTKQNAKLFCVAWSPNSQNFCTGSLDTSLAIWTLEEKYDKRVAVFIKDAHKKADVRRVAWLSDNIVASCGADSCIRQWIVKC